MFDHKVQVPESLGDGRVSIAIIVQETQAASLLENCNTHTKMSEKCHSIVNTHMHTKTSQ